VEWKFPKEKDGKKPPTVHLKIRKPKDVGGEEEQRETATGWRDVCAGSDFLFYLFDASTASEDRVLQRICRDFDWIANNAQSFAAGFKIIILANKMDKFDADPSGQEVFIRETLPAIEKTTREALGPYALHLVLATPCSLLKNKDRAAPISLTLKHLAELE
jgi:hypothetical protein